MFQHVGNESVSPVERSDQGGMMRLGRVRERRRSKMPSPRDVKELR